MEHAPGEKEIRKLIEIRNNGPYKQLGNNPFHT